MMNLRRATVGAASVLMMVGLGASGCNGDESTTGDGGMGGSGGVGGGSAGACPAEMMCFALKPMPGEGLPVEAGRVVVLWYQFIDDGPDPLPLIAYDAAFDPKLEEVWIPLADIAPPNEENMLCERACDDEALCPCLGDLKVGTGVVLAVRDTDMSGEANLDTLKTDWYGTGYMGVGHSGQELVPAPSPLDRLFPEGIDKGTRPYRVIEGDVFDMLGRTQGDVFDLNVCNAPSATCTPPFPNLT